MQKGPPPDEIRDAKASAPRPKPPTPRKKSLETEIGALLISANLMASPFIKNDMLDELEIMALAHAVDEQAQRSPRFRKMVIRAIETAGGANLFTIVLIIAGRRAARHGVIDPSWDNTLRGFLAVSKMDIDMTDPDAAAAAMYGVFSGAAKPEPTSEGPVS